MDSRVNDRSHHHHHDRSTSREGRHSSRSRSRDRNQRQEKQVKEDRTKKRTDYSDKVLVEFFRVSFVLL